MSIFFHLKSKYSQLTLVCVMLVLTFPVLAIANNHQNPGSYSLGTPVGLQNPLDPSISSIPAFFLAILDILLVFAIPFIVFFIIYAGFLYVTARGNASVIEKAHRALLYALIGGLLILGARGILNIITNTVNSVVMSPAIELTVSPQRLL